MIVRMTDRPPVTVVGTVESIGGGYVVMRSASGTSERIATVNVLSGNRVDATLPFE